MCVCCYQQPGTSGHRPACRSQLQGTWDYERFRKEHLTRYLRNCELALLLQLATSYHAADASSVSRPAQLWSPTGSRDWHRVT